MIVFPTLIGFEISFGLSNPQDEKSYIFLNLRVEDLSLKFFKSRFLTLIVIYFFIYFLLR